MNIEINNGNFKKTVIFFPGYTKTGADFNVPKNIAIEEHIRKTYNTVLITIEDYRIPINDITTQIYDKIVNLLRTKLILLSHSYGSFYAMDFVITYNTLNTSLILIEPCVKTDNFLFYLKSLPFDEVNQWKINNFEYYPNHLLIPKQCIVKIHLDFDGSDYVKEKIYELDKIIKKHTKSRLMVHANIGHMIHYKIPHVIIDTIKSI